MAAMIEKLNYADASKFKNELDAFKNPNIRNHIKANCAAAENLKTTHTEVAKHLLAIIGELKKGTREIAYEPSNGVKDGTIKVHKTASKVEYVKSIAFLALGAALVIGSGAICFLTGFTFSAVFLGTIGTVIGLVEVALGISRWKNAKKEIEICSSVQNGRSVNPKELTDDPVVTKKDEKQKKPTYRIPTYTIKNKVAKCSITISKEQIDHIRDYGYYDYQKEPESPYFGLSFARVYAVITGEDVAVVQARIDTAEK